MNLWKSMNKEIREMEEKKLELAIRKMVAEANLNSKSIEMAKKNNFPLMEKDYFSRNLGIGIALYHLGYTLKEKGKRADRKSGVEYIYYEAIER